MKINETNYKSNPIWQTLNTLDAIKYRDIAVRCFILEVL